MKVRCESTNRIFTLAKELGSGGEGRVFSVQEEPALVGKIWHKDSDQKKDKVREMLASRPIDPMLSSGKVSIAWPQSIVKEVNGLGCGYLMPRINHGVEIGRLLLPAQTKTKYPNFGLQHKLRAAVNLCSIVIALHNKNYIIGDFNDANVLVMPDATIALIDCDSFQVGRHLCSVGTPQYLPPELQGVPLKGIVRKFSSDNFILAVLLYRICCDGYHPFQGCGGGPESIGERIQGGYYAYAASKGVSPPKFAPPREAFPKQLFDGFYRSFYDGHQKPESRPDAKAWFKTVLDLEKRLISCGKNQTHFYFDSLAFCPHCKKDNVNTRSTNNRPRNITPRVAGGTNKAFPPKSRTGKQPVRQAWGNNRKKLCGFLILALFFAAYLVTVKSLSVQTRLSEVYPDWISRGAPTVLNPEEGIGSAMHRTILSLPTTSKKSPLPDPPTENASHLPTNAGTSLYRQYFEK